MVHTEDHNDDLDRLLADHAIVLFDGVCNLCNTSVNFIIDHDPDGYFKFAPLQSDIGQRLLRRCGVEGDGLDSIVLIEGERAYHRSAAALRIARRLRGVWSWLYGLLIVPRPIRDRVYDWVARHRYRWFGRTDQCRIPTPELRRRFLDYTPVSVGQVNEEPAPSASEGARSSV